MKSDWTNPSHPMGPYNPMNPMNPLSPISPFNPMNQRKSQDSSPRVGGQDMSPKEGLLMVGVMVGLLALIIFGMWWSDRRKKRRLKE